MELATSVLLTAFIITFAAIKALHPFAFYVSLLDKPGGRKKHDGAIPLVGGLGMFVGIFLASYVFLEQPMFIRFFMLASGLMVFMGMLDDRYALSARFRLAGQFIVACIFVYGLDIKLVSFGNLFGLGEVHLGVLAYPLTILSLIGIVNAVNMLDGMDGLVGSLGFVSFLGLAILFAGSEPSVNLFMLSISFLGAIGAFLIFNLWGRPSENGVLLKVFMGDAGSMFVGLGLGVLVIVGSQEGTAVFKPTTALWFVLFPMTDMFTLMYRRLKRGKSPLAPDRTHIHHILMRAGFNCKQTLYIMILAQAILVSVGLLCELVFHSEIISCALALLFAGFYQLLMKRSWRFIRWNKRRFSHA